MIVWYFSVRQFLGDNWDCNNASVAVASVAGSSAWEFHLNPHISWSSGSFFQMFAVVHCEGCPLAGDGYLYILGTPCGREGNAYLARVSTSHVLNQHYWQYYRGGNGVEPMTSQVWSSDSTSATVVLQGGVGELSVRQFREQYHVVLYATSTCCRHV
eukprot:m.340510 g.340510  ORF g.340510 m.340510 type:complete len:157 (-) comp20595_c0_seq12:86-556(-)